ncbi:MAG TPA: DUF1707 and DUF4190 domain-containing protein [Streptosporangiaceae bacterium]|nr:DUF1707 and DUF4190 domain-containing protein [Streptosporangiaceae bacterium]
MTMGPGYGLAASGPGLLRASDADRERAAEVLRTGFAEGRLDKDEYDTLLGQVYSAQTYGDLVTVTSQLPGGGYALFPGLFGAPARYPAPAHRTNGLAVASLACGVAQFLVPLPASILAIVFGHIARGQIRRTGERGAGLAMAGLVLGWAQVVIAIIAVVAITMVR